jgi:hypothetical protein
MNVTFDLISDLHVDALSTFDWEGKSTSLICVVAGNVSKDLALVISTLKHLSTCYRLVLFIDGSNEHHSMLSDLKTSYSNILAQLEELTNVIFLQNQIVIINGVAFIGSNGWWTYDFNDSVTYDQAKALHKQQSNVTDTTMSTIESIAMQDYAYLSHTVTRLQTHNDVKKIVVVTHTVPLFKLIEHSTTQSETNIQSMLGNSFIRSVKNADSENKITTWCFGHYHSNIDQTLNNTRYVSNNVSCSLTPYNPLRVVVSY